MTRGYISETDMYRNYKVVANTAAGRRRYMQYLVPYVVSSDIVDRYDIWVNTHDGADIEFFRLMAEMFPKVNLVWQPDGVVNGNKSINAFYRACVEADTVYFKLDDDVVWMEPGLIVKMVRFRVENPQYFLVSPLVVNNALSTYLLQVEGRLRLDACYEAYATHPVLWKNGHFAAALHDWFIGNYLEPRRWEELYVGKKEMGMTRFSINAVLWLGDEMRKFAGVVPGDDEDFLSCFYPTQKGMLNAWNGDALVAHFAFFPQRGQLDRLHILERYGEACRRDFMASAETGMAYKKVQEAMEYVRMQEEELMRRQSPYRSVPAVKTLRSRVKGWLPEIVQEFLLFRYGQKRKGGFIVE